MQLPPATGPQVTLRPDRARAALWTLVGLAATGLAAFTFGSSQAPLLAGLLVLLCAVPTGVFGLQLLAPEAWTIELDRRGMHGTVATMHVTESFHGLRAVELGRVGGDATLVLLGPSSRRTLLLPVGCDLTALRELLGQLEQDAARGHGHSAGAVADGTT